MKLGISVIICCYNSATRLAETLLHLSKQELDDGISVEVIIVDNASTDGTKQVAESFCNNNGSIIIRIITENKPGKIFALATGIESAIHHYILVCDDDNWLAPDYITKALKLIATHPEIGAIGGRSTHVSEMEIPESFHQYLHSYAVGKQYHKTGYLTEKKYLWGAGMVFRKSDYIRIYAKYPALLLGPTKGFLTRGEDVEFCMRLLLMDYQLYYDENLFFQHFIPKERLTKSYRDKFFEDNEYESLVLGLYTRQINFLRKTFLAKAVLVYSSLLRIGLKLILRPAKWSLDYESDSLLFSSGILLGTATKEGKMVRNIYLEMKKLKRG